jgi:hypothetical protein
MPFAPASIADDECTDAPAKPEPFAHLYAEHEHIERMCFDARSAHEAAYWERKLDEHKARMRACIALPSCVGR